jgi:hypothetical protein
MHTIFISYRRDDTEGQVGRLFNDLAHYFGDDAVFMDVAAIEPGRDFRRAIDQQVASCSVLLALIGNRWVTAQDESGARRLDDPMDFVRLETASALKRDIPVVPVLVQGARMPRVEALPEDLKELAFRNGVELTHARWDSDVQLLVNALRPYVQVKQAPPSSLPRSAPSESGLSRSIPSRMIIVALVSLMALAGGWYMWQQMGSQERARQTDSPRYGGLVGSWTADPGAQCKLVFWKDDGKNVEGNCGTGVDHKIIGLYTAKNIIKITITRIDEKQCETKVDGYIEILNSDTVEISQDGWNGCEVKTDPLRLRWRRS